MHESDTFNPNPTEEKDFTVRRGEEVTREADWARFLRAQGVEIIPTLHAVAEPGGVVSRKTYEERYSLALRLIPRLVLTCRESIPGRLPKSSSSRTRTASIARRATPPMLYNV
jgi:hypothetical protein